MCKARLYKTDLQLSYVHALAELIYSPVQNRLVASTCKYRVNSKVNYLNLPQLCAHIGRTEVLSYETMSLNTTMVTRIPDKMRPRLVKQQQDVTWVCTMAMRQDVR